MELHKQIKTLRMNGHMSQEELAERIYVTRQTVSNWETGKSYPDIHSLLLMSSMFNVTLDQMIQGDLTIMKETLKTEEITKFNQDSKIFACLFFLTILSTAPLFYYLKIAGAIIFTLLFIITMYYAIKVDKQKKDNNVQTYKEIIAFSNGEHLDEIHKNRELGKRPYQKFLIVIGFTILAFIISFAFLSLFTLFD